MFATKLCCTRGQPAIKCRLDKSASIHRYLLQRCDVTQRTGLSDYVAVKLCGYHECLLQNCTVPEDNRLLCADLTNQLLQMSVCCESATCNKTAIKLWSNQIWQLDRLASSIRMFATGCHVAA